MAKSANTNKVTFGRKSKKRKGVTSKNKTSWNKNSKNYKKHTEVKVGRRLLIDRLIDEKCDRLIKNKSINMPQHILNSLAGHSANEKQRKLSLG